MATEYRRITFTNAELRSALESHLSPNGNGSIPKGDINSVKSIQKNGDFFYELTMFDYSKRKESSMLIEQGETESALLDHCIETGISLPRLARKETRYIDDRLCLELFLE